KSRALPARLPVGGYRAVCMVVPALRSEIAYLWFNPPWIIPPTILREDVMPQGARRSGISGAGGHRGTESAGGSGWTLIWFIACSWARFGCAGDRGHAIR